MADFKGPGGSELSPGEIRKLFDAVRDLTTQNTRLIAIVREVILKRYADMGEIVASIPGRLELLEMAVRESSEDEANAIRALAGQVQRLEELELLRQTGHYNSDRSQQLRENIRDEHTVKHLREMLFQVTKNLQRAQLKRARLGDRLDVSLENDIEEYEAARAQIEQELEAALGAVEKHQAGG